ncbi:MAG: ATP-binding cassette domain-containing protein [bacterium]|nr:ATP-binding cassette domain-containing protein [bacterium]
MIEAQGLTRRYGEFTAVQGLSFSVAEGEILGMLGPNGAGKTTTIRMITGFLPPSSGRVTVAGHDLLTAPGRARREIGYLPESVALYPEMRVREYLAYRARLEGMTRTEARHALGLAIERCLLEEVERQIIGTLSKGYRQRVGLATAILHGPRVLVLDEPTIGLDPKQIIAIRELIRELGRKHTLLVSTHILPEVEQLCDRVLIIDHGRLVAEGTPQELREQSRGNALLRVTIKEAPDDARDVFRRIAGVVDVRPVPGSANGEFTLECDQGMDLRETVFRTAVDQQWILLELVEEKVSLEDVFVRLTDQEAEDDLDPAPSHEPSEHEEVTS